MAQRRTYGSISLHLCHFSDISRASRHTKVSIQRIYLCFPPAISAGNLQKLQLFVQILHFVLIECC
jgi:hypothetical protein